MITPGNRDRKSIRKRFFRLCPRAHLGKCSVNRRLAARTPSVPNRSFTRAASTVCHYIFDSASGPPQASGTMRFRAVKIRQLSMMSRLSEGSLGCECPEGKRGKRRGAERAEAHYRDAGGHRANIVGAGLVDGVARAVTLQHGFGNSGAAKSYLRQNEPMLRERAQEWLANPSARPNSDSTRRLLREELTVKFGSKLVRLLLTGSRARGNPRSNSDWDLVAVVDGARRCGPEGPIARSHHAPDGNPVDLITIPPADFDHPAQFMAEMRMNHTEL